MRLFFDARYIRWDFHDGISRFSTELAAAVAEASTDRDVEVTFLICDERQRMLLPAGARTLMLHAPTALREPLSALIVNRHRPDVLYSPMQTIGTIGRRFGLILTLHDMIYYRHRTPPRDLPGFVRLGWRLFHLSYVPQRITLNAADVVATVSETTRAEFEAVHLTRRPIVVIPNAPRPLAELLPAGEEVRAGDRVRNLVYMGSFMPYKNVETLIDAMRLLPGRRLHLLSRIEAHRRAELAARVGDADVVFHDGVSDGEYAALLADQAALVTTSLDEGYGLPVAEALAMGVPAVVTDMPIFREVAGDGALFVDPHDAAAVAEAVQRLDDPARRAQLAAAGAAHIARFSWERSAEVLLEAAVTAASRR